MREMMNQKGAIPVFVLLAIIGIIAFIAISSFAPFKDKLFASLYPKTSSRAEMFPGTPLKAFYGYQFQSALMGMSRVLKFAEREERQVNIVAFSGEGANLFDVRIKYDPAFVEVSEVKTNPAYSDITNWIVPPQINTSNGTISLVGGVDRMLSATPGGDGIKIGQINFKGKKAGTASVRFLEGSTMYLSEGRTPDTISIAGDISLEVTPGAAVADFSVVCSGSLLPGGTKKIRWIATPNPVGSYKYLWKVSEQKDYTGPSNDQTYDYSCGTTPKTANITVTRSDLVTHNFSCGSVMIPCGTGVVGDISGDAVVTLKDMSILLSLWNTKTGDTRFNPLADLNSDGTINSFDFTAMLYKLYPERAK